MAPAADQDGGSTAPAAAAPALRRQLSYSCSHGRAESMHDRKLSYSSSFSTPAASPSTLPLPNKSSSCESIPVLDELDRQSSFSSTSSYESLFQLDGAAGPQDHDCSSFLEFVPATRAPAVQTMMEQGQPSGAGGGYDPKRLSSSMFRTRSTSPAEWSATSNDSLFSIQLGHSGEVGSLYGDLYYDASGGFHRLPSVWREAWKLPAVSEASSGDAGGGLCVREDCARCSGSGMNRKSVRFAATESISGGSKHSAVFPTLAAALEEAPATEAKAPGTAMEGWCVFGCCWPSPPSMWWPRCACSGCDCRCGDCRWV